MDEVGPGQRSPRLRRRALGGACALACILAGADAAGSAVPGDPAGVTRQAPAALEEATSQVPQAGDLPGPAKDAVETTPVAPVAGGVRDTVGNATGGGSGGGGSTGSGSTGAGAGSGATTGSPGPARTGGGSARTRRSARRPGTAGAASGSGSGRDTAREGGRRVRQPAAGGADPDRLAVGRPASEGSDGEAGDSAGVLRDIVEVVPGWMKAVLGVLAALALAFGARMLVERRRARRFDGERARLQADVGVLQRALLPDVPAYVGGLATSVSYRPAEGLAAGGDFYDVFELGDGRVAVMVGDVSGHGHEALMSTASVRHSLGAYLRAGTDPRGALAAAGELLPMGDDARFTTVVLAVHDPLAGTLTYALAGHPPPVFTGAASHEPISCVASPPVGVGVPTGLRQTTVALPPGSTACFYTDGLIEARCPDGLLGRERLAELIERLPEDRPAAELIARVDEVADASGDDLAVCVVRATAGPHAPAARLEEVEVGPSPSDLARAGRLMEACGVLADDAAAIRDELAAADRALLRIRLTDPPLAAVEPLGRDAASLLPA